MLLLLLLSRFSRVRLCATPQTAAHQAPPFLGFSIGSRNHTQKVVSTPCPLEGSRERQKEKEFVHRFLLTDLEAEAKSRGQQKW